MTNTDFLEEPRLSSDEINDLAQKMDGVTQFIEVKEKSTIVKAGEFDSDIYIVIDGEAVVEIPLKGRWMAVSWLNEGSVIGELSFFDSRPRAARVVARTGCRLYRVRRELFDSFISRFPADAMRFVWRLAEIMAYRIRRVEQFDAIEHGRNEERKGIAADLHDQTMNDLSAISMNLGLLKFTASDKFPEIASEIDSIGNLVKNADGKLRSIVKGMAQDSVVRFGLVKALEVHFEELTTRVQVNKAALSLKFSCEGFGNGRLPEAVAIDLFNIVHQSVANSLAHSQAKMIMVRLQWRKESLGFSVQDDGIGFDSSGAHKIVESGHFGLLNLKLRAERMSGTLSLDSKPGEGTLISGSIPITNDGERLSSKSVSEYVL